MIVLSKIKVKGLAKLEGNFELELPVTEEEFDSLTWREQDSLIKDYLSGNAFHNFVNCSDLEIEDVYDIEESK